MFIFEIVWYPKIQLLYLIQEPLAGIHFILNLKVLHLSINLALALKNFHTVTSKFSSDNLIIFSTLTTFPSCRNRMGRGVPRASNQAIISIGFISIFILTTLRPISSDTFSATSYPDEFVLTHWALIMGY